VFKINYLTLINELIDIYEFPQYVVQDVARRLEYNFDRNYQKMQHDYLLRFVDLGKVKLRKSFTFAKKQARVHKSH
jgi:hypothetical protein